MPTKVNFKYTFDENEDQALIGDSYEVLINIEPEDITLAELNLEIENVESETVVNLNEIPMLEQSISLTQSVDDSLRSTKDNTLQLSKQNSTQIRPIQVERTNSNLIGQNDVIFSPTTGLPMSKPRLELKDVEIFYIIGNGEKQEM